MAAPTRIDRVSVVYLALPAMTGALLQNAFRPLDHFFVKELGPEAQVALGGTSLVAILAFGFFQILSAGAGPIIARATGADEPEARRQALGAALIGCTAMALVMALVGGVLAEPIIQGIGLQGAAAQYGVDYLQVLFLTGAALVFAPTIDASFQAMGDTRLPMLLQLCALAVNAVLTPTLIVYGYGTAGAAFASTVAQTLAVVVGLVVLWRRIGMTLGHLSLQRLGEIISIGFPMGTSTIAFAFAYWLLMATVIHQLEPEVYAALGIGFSILEGVAYPVFAGCMVAAASLVGRCLGAQQVEQAVRASRTVLELAVVLGLCFSVAFWTIGTPLTAVFAADDAVHRECIRYAMVLAWVQPLVAIEAVAEGVLAGAGDTKKVLWATVPLNLLRVPLAWGLAIWLGFGADGLWWAINISTLLKAVTKWGMVSHGGWTQVEVLVTNK